MEPGAMLNIMCVGVEEWIGCHVDVMQKLFDLPLAFALKDGHLELQHTQNVYHCNIPFPHSPPPPFFVF